MKTLFKNVLDNLTEAAMLEEGIRLDSVVASVCDPFEETLEENLIEVAFAEAADFDDIHKAILREHRLHCAAA
jgi:molecular chaperone GrpE (heat shock protein)